MLEALIESFSENKLPMLLALGILICAGVGLSMSNVAGGPSRRRVRQLYDLRTEGAPIGRFRPTSHAHIKDEDLEDLEGEVDRTPLPLKVLASIARSLPLLGQKDREKVGVLLHSAGLQGEDALGLYVAAKLISAALGGLIVLGLIGYLGWPSSTLFRLVGILGGTIIGGMIPEIIVKRMVSNRENRINKAIPDALDLMVICTESGLSLDPTMQRVARELRLSSPELAKELAIVSHELRILPKRETALMNLAERNQNRTVRSLVTTLVQTMKYGTSLSHALRVLASESRSERMLAAEEKAAKLPAKMSLPLVCCMLPAVFLIIAGPAVSQVMQLR